MARNSEFYKGRRKKRNYALVPFAIVLALVTLLVDAFYGAQKYAVISDDGVVIKLPTGGDGEDGLLVDDAAAQTFEPVELEVVFDPPDYSRVEVSAGEHSEPIRAIYLAAEDLSEDNINAAADRLVNGNALLLEMKPRSGLLMWRSNSAAAQGYGLIADADVVNAMPRLVSELKERGIYLVAQISCCLDEAFSTRSTKVALRHVSGWNYTDKEGSWLDPYNQDVRSYIIEITRELYDMGFDEVVLADVMHPVFEQEEGEENQPPELMYTRQMSTDPTPVNAVCGFAVYVAQELEDRSGLLSIYCNTRTALAKPDMANGQDAALFMKIYDRVYFPTDSYTYSFNVQDMQNSVPVGSVYDRLVPVVVNYLPSDNSSWIYIEEPEEEE